MKMRTYILTERDRQIIKQFLDESLMLDGFRDLKWRVTQQVMQGLKSDIKLLEAFKEKLDIK